MFQKELQWLKGWVMMGVCLSFIAILPVLVLTWHRDREDVPRFNAMHAMLSLRLDDEGRYPEGIAKGMNTSPDVRHLFGHPAFVDIGPLESPGNEPGVCYYQTSWDRRIGTLYVNNRSGELAKVWTMHAPIP